MEIEERDGPRGGEYLFVRLDDGRRLSLSSKLGDDGVWLGRPDEPDSYTGQPGGIGRLDKLLDEWRARAALDPEARELYEAGRALARRKEEAGAECPVRTRNRDVGRVFSYHLTWSRPRSSADRAPVS
jgi:hypothetical protein